MALSLTLLVQILSLFIMIIAGGILFKTGILKHGESQILSKACVYIFQPCMMLNGFLTNWTKEKLQGLLLASVGAVLIHAVYLILNKLLKKPLQLNEIDEGSLVFTNAANVVIPLVQGTLGSEFVVYTSAYLVVQNLIVWSYGVKLIGRQKDMQLKRIMKNPTIIAICIGILFVIFPISMPLVLRRTVSDLGVCMAPVSMVMIGLICAEFDMNKLKQVKGLWRVVFFRLLIYPLFGMAILSTLSRLVVIPNAWQILFVVMLGAAGPSASLVVQVAQLYNNKEDRASAINVITTLACVVTMPLMTILAQLAF